MQGNLKIRENFDGHRCPPKLLSTDTDVRRNRIGVLQDGDLRRLPVFPPYRDQAARLQLEQRPALGPGVEASMGGEFIGWQDEGLTPVPEILVQHDHEDEHARWRPDDQTTC